MRNLEAKALQNFKILENHKKLFFELSSDFASIFFMPKSRTALENMNELILLDLKILLDAENAWQHSGEQHDFATAALSQAGGDDDKSASAKTQDLLQATLLVRLMV